MFRKGIRTLKLMCLKRVKHNNVTHAKGLLREQSVNVCSQPNPRARSTGLLIILT